MKKEDDQTLETSKLWKLTKALIQPIDGLARHIPYHEQYTLGGPLHRMAVSLTSDIAMAVGKGYKDAVFDYRYARGHLLTIKSLVLITQDYGYVKETSRVLIEIEAIRRLLDEKIDKLQAAEDEVTK